MNCKYKTFAAHVALFALLLAVTPVQAAGARLEGYVVGVDGRGAPEHRVHLIDDQGQGVATAQTSEKGVYRFRDLPAGAYSLGIESPEGKMAPVAAPPTELASAELARRDIKLVSADRQQREAVATQNADFGLWWAGLSAPAKAWSIVGVFVLLGVTFAALDDETAASN